MTRARAAIAARGPPLGEPKLRQGSAHLCAGAFLVFEPGEGGFDAFGLAQPQEGSQGAGPDRRRGGVRCDELGGQPFGGLEVSQRVGETAMSEFESPRAKWRPIPAAG